MRVSVLTDVLTEVEQALPECFDEFGFLDQPQAAIVARQQVGVDSFGVLSQGLAHGERFELVVGDVIRLRRPGHD